MAEEATEAVATRFIDELRDAFEPVRHFPLAASSREQFAPGLRVTFHRAYAIYYRALPNAIVIIRVLHGARDTTAIAERGGFAE